MRNETPCDVFEKNLAFCLSHAFSNANSLQTITYRTDKNFVTKNPAKRGCFFYLLLFILRLVEYFSRIPKSFHVVALSSLLPNNPVVCWAVEELNRWGTQSRTACQRGMHNKPNCHPTLQLTDLSHILDNQFDRRIYFRESARHILEQLFWSVP